MLGEYKTQLLASGSRRRENAMTTISETLKTSGTFGALVQALEAAGLDETLNGDGPFTVFAPSEAAFDELSKEAFAEIVRDKERLGNVLKYHVLEGRYKAADIDTISRATTLEGDDVEFHRDNGLHVDEAAVVSTDMMADNGVIHTIDKVLLPEKYLY